MRALRDLYVGRNYLVTGEPEQALRHFEQSEGHARTMNDPALLAKRLRYQGYLTVFAGRYAEAERLGSEGVEIAQAARDIVSQVSFIWVIGIARVEVGRYGEARQILQDGLSQAGTLGEDHYYIARLLNTLGYLYNEVGNLDAAMQWNRRALEINQSAAAVHQPVHALSYTLLDLATNQLHRGRLDAARGRFTPIGIDAERFLLWGVSLFEPRAVTAGRIGAGS